MRRFYFIVLINLVYTNSIDPSYAILDSIVNKLAPRSVKVEMLQINIHPNKNDRTFKYEYYSDNIENAQYVKYIYPKKVKNNSFLIKNDGKDIWAYFNRTKRVRKLASHQTKQGMQNSEFTFQDLGRNDSWFIDFNVVLEESDDLKLKLMLKNGIDSDFSKIVINADRKTYYPTKISYYKDDFNEKTLFLNDIEKNGDYIYSKVMIMKNNRTNAETHMIIENMSFNIDINKNIFNENMMSR